MGNWENMDTQSRNIKQPTLSDLESLARQAGKILLERFGREHQVNYKGEYDLATEADHASEEFLVRQIRERFPEDPIVTEERGSLSGSSANGWFTDPLDGTLNFAHGVPIYSVSIGYARDGILQLGAIYDPSRDECFTAERGRGAWRNGSPIHVSSTQDLARSLLVTGFPHNLASRQKNNNMENFSRLEMRTQAVRRMGSAALDFCWVAAGAFDGFWEIELSPWDLAAGTLIAAEAGALVTDLAGDPDFFRPPYAVLAASPAIHPQMVAALQER